MNSFKYLLYQFLKWLTITSLRIYYPDTTIINKEHLKHKRPSILVSNHPNTLIDPVITACEIPMMVHFLAFAGLFRTPFLNWLFSFLYCIPIQRYEDTNGEPLNNKSSFDRCDDFLGDGGCLYIAPEGVSFVERKLRRIKTGTARIALSAAAKKNFDLDLYIYPVGINYEALNYFRTKIFINVGTPIKIKGYQAQYEIDPITAVRQLSKDLEEELSRLLISSKDEEEDHLLRQLEILSQNEQPLEAEPHFHRTKRLISVIREQQQEAPSAYQQLINQANTYFDQLKQYRTSDRSVYNTPTYSIKDYAALIAGFPIFLLGSISHLLPVGITLLAVRMKNLYVGYNTTAKIIFGLVVFPIFYLLQTYLVATSIGMIPALVYLLTVYPTGSYAWGWHKKYKRYKEDKRVRPVRKALLQNRQDLKQAIHNFLKISL